MRAFAVSADPHARAATRLEWIASEVDVAVVVDVLSFTTTLTVAADRGTVVHPYRWRDESAVRFAADHDAVLAGGRSQGGVSLSPASIRAAADLPRLVLPSPNGSTICALLADTVSLVVGVSVRNRAAAAAWLRRRRADNPDLRVAVVAAGERWQDGSLRPAVEDLWGAGGLLSVLIREGWTASPEARAAAAAFDVVGADVETALHDCASGRELDGIGFANDVDTAAELDASASVPLLVDGRFVSARS